ncbi:HWE histidine kinase domain-containing protein [Roseomonas sp. CCTCC AB2023176]|uniref:HWE histidine kinase domain-containing protein n=1 Tax=Roseomonas sp. CCTCC AB2023176 TaxID=3342640 RepID=UPI0035E2271F
MQPWTAVSVILAGAALWFLAAGRRAGALPALGVLLIAAGALFQHATGRDLGVDTLLFGEAVIAAPPRHGPYPGRISIGTATSFALLGAALLGLAVARGHGGRAAAAGLALAAALPPAFALLGYAAGLDPFQHGVLRRWAMSLPTAVAIGAGAVGTLSLAWPRWRARTARWSQAMLVLGVLLPALGLAGALAMRLAVAERARLEDQAASAAADLAALVAREFTLQRGRLQALAASPALAEGDLRAFHALASGMQAATGTHVLLVDAAGRHVLNTRLPPDSPSLPGPPTSAAFRALEAVPGAGMVVSDVVRGAVTNRAVVNVAVLASLRGEPAALVAIGEVAGPWTEAIDRFGARLPAGWVVTLADGAGTIVARYPEPARFVGTPLVNPFAERLRAELVDPAAEGGWIRDAATRDGQVLHVAWDRVAPEAPRWTALIGIPDAAITTPLRRAMAPLLLGGGVLVTVGIALALRRARRLAAPLERLAIAGPAGAANLPPSGIAEVDRLAASLAASEAARGAEEARRTLLSREVDHRAKNVLAIVGSILRLTRAPDVPTYIAAAEQRIAALARTHTLLARDGWTGAGLRTILEEELAPYDPGRILLEGPAVALTPGVAQPLSMALHELATNAAKHGALSVPEGRLRVAWTVVPDLGDLSLWWEETGGPPVESVPGRRGFGSGVLEATVRRQIGGALRLDWLPTGLVCGITLPADGFVRAS